MEPRRTGCGSGRNCFTTQKETHSSKLFILIFQKCYHISICRYWGNCSNPTILIFHSYRFVLTNIRTKSGFGCGDVSHTAKNQVICLFFKKNPKYSLKQWECSCYFFLKLMRLGKESIHCTLLLFRVNRTLC